MAVSVVVRVLLARSIATPWILSDEFTYSELARSFAASGHFMIRDAPTTVVSYLYPVLIAPAWLAGSMHDTYLIAKAINAVAMTLVAIPVYLWARRVSPPPLALAAATLTLLMPAFFYTGELMTENAFLPVYVLACFGLALVLERPSWLNQALLLGSVGLAIAIRFQSLVLLVVLPTAVLLKLGIDLLARERPVGEVLRRDLLALWPTAAALAVAAIAYAAYERSRGMPLRSGLGSYEVTTSLGYTFREAARWTLYHFSEVPLMVGYIPLCAFLVMLGLAVWQPRTLSAAERALVAVALPGTVWLVVEVATFASRTSLRVEERYMFPATALLVIALAAWLARAAPRPRTLTVLAALVPVLLLLPLPLARLLNISITSDTFGLIPLLRLSDILSGGEPLVKKLVIVGGIVGSLLFAFVPRRLAAPVLLSAIGIFFVLTSYSVHGDLRDYSHNIAGGTGVLTQPTWVDDHAGNHDVGVLFGRASDPFQEDVALWENEFWNKRLKRVYALDVPEPVGFPDTLTTAVRGRLSAPGSARELQRTRYMLAASDLALAGTRVAQQGPFSLYRLESPPRIASNLTGLYADGWSGPNATYTEYAPKGAGRLRVVVSRAAWGGPDRLGRVTVTVSPVVGSPPKPFAIHAGKTRVVTVRTPARPYTVQVRITPTFSPAQFGYADTRQLGAVISFARVSP